MLPVSIKPAFTCFVCAGPDQIEDYLRITKALESKAAKPSV